MPSKKAGHATGGARLYRAGIFQHESPSLLAWERTERIKPVAGFLLNGETEQSVKGCAAHRITSIWRFRLPWCYAFKPSAKAETVASAALKAGASP